MGNIIDLVDQAAFAAERATGTTNMLQCVWVYDRAIDLDGVRRFHRNLQRGRLSRRIERSTVPFGRHRWVSPPDQSDLEIVERPRPRARFDAWLDEQTDTALDAELGPGWHLAVLAFTDGGAGVSLVVSHTLIDGVGLCAALADAADGRDDPIRWPAARSRRRWQAVRDDTRQAARDVPAIGRAAVAAARFARRTRHGDASGTRMPGARPSPTAGPDQHITPAKATIFVDADQWDVRAQSLGGTSNALLAGLTAGIAQRVGRVAPDGLATLAIPVNERADDDTRANAITSVDIVVDPATSVRDLREIRAALKQGLTRHAEVPDERLALLPLTPLLPRWLIRQMLSVALGGETTSGSSNLGEVDPAANRPDGTDADYFAMKSLCPGATKATAQQTGGLLGLLSGRVNGQVFVSVFAYQPDRATSNDALRQSLSAVLSEFSLPTTIDWSCPGPVSESLT